MIFTVYDNAGGIIAQLEADKAVYGDNFTALLRNNKDRISMLYAQINHKNGIVRPFLKIHNQEGTGCVTKFIPEVGSVIVSVKPPKEEDSVRRKIYIFDSPKRCPCWSDKSGHPICSYYPGKPALCSRDQIPENCPLEDATAKNQKEDKQ